MAQRKQRQVQLLSLSLAGRPEDKGDVRLGDFTEFLFEALRCLRAVDRTLTGRHYASADYRITGLKHGSATVELEPVPYKKAEDYTARIVKTFTEGLATIMERGEAPQYFDRPLLENFRRLAKPLNRGRVQTIEIRSDHRKVSITKLLEVNIDKIIGEDIKSDGSIAGHLDVVNVHDESFFYIFPVAGPAKIGCRFGDEQLDDVKAALKKYVTVSGTFLYKKNEVFPYQIEVGKIEIHPPKEELPTLSSLRGIAPDMTGKLDSVGFVRKLRNAS